MEEAASPQPLLFTIPPNPVQHGAVPYRSQETHLVACELASLASIMVNTNVHRVEDCQTKATASRPEAVHSFKQYNEKSSQTLHEHSALSN